jgi:hypothetical protein
MNRLRVRQNFKWARVRFYKDGIGARAQVRADDPIKPAEFAQRVLLLRDAATF